MKNLLNFIILPALLSVFLACNKPAQNIPHYTVSKVLKSDTLTTVNVHINNRLTARELLSIAGKLKSDSAQLQNLKICYLLPGNTDVSVGDNSYYAAARYLKKNEVKPTDTLKDDKDNVFRIKIFGLSREQVKTLLALQPKEITGKNVLGKYIDDYSHTVIIPFKDVPQNDKLYIIELDSSAKIVSATMPLKVKDNKAERWQVTQNGDYITIKDSVLTQYAADGLGMPFNSIKSGI
ncbi:MAG: hypothetical protein JWP44_1844 [Mucilaginibacter sp.]|nr:hypothetical protein [Mucilaginibacter sp.]